MSKKVKLIESMITWQGEGPDSGQRMLLCRFKKCNRGDTSVRPYYPACKYCDTLVKMRSSIETDYPISNIQNTINEEKLGLLITGGEPTFLNNFDYTIDLIENLNIKFGNINIETNGYDLFHLIQKSTNKNPNNNIIKYIYSPKFFNLDEVNNEIQYISEFKNIIDKNIFLKIVYVYDLSELIDLFLYNVLKYFNNKNVYLMPEGKDKDELLKNSGIVFDKCEEFKLNFSSRQHIIYSFI